MKQTVLTTPPAGLVAETRRQSVGPVGDELAVLSEQARSQFGPGVAAVLFYGSCLRGNRLDEGLIDLYALVDSYQAVYHSTLLRLANSWLPPNVFMLQVRTPEGRLLQAKCAVISIEQFEQGTALWRQSYLWGRFAQPSRLVYTRDEDVRGRVHTALGRAIVTLLECTLPCMPDRFDAEAIWRRGLALSYGTELRPEAGDRGDNLVGHDRAVYHRLVAEAEPAVSAMESVGGGSYINWTGLRERKSGQRQWKRRRVGGRVLHVVRLIKSLLTFDNGVDYLAWKLERHTGEPVDVTPRLRKYPLIFGWPLLWRLWREKQLR